jgi:hypothetical protein
MGSVRWLLGTTKEADDAVLLLGKVKVAASMRELAAG